jgi:hypothetical protein
MPAIRRRQLGYGLGAELVMLLLGRLPVLSDTARHLGPELRFLVVPVALAGVLSRCAIDGRPAHAVLHSFLALQLRPARLVAWRPSPLPARPVVLGSIRIVADERGARLRPAVISGPAHLRVRYPIVVTRSWHTTCVEAQPGPPSRRSKEIHVGSGQKVVIR